MSKKMGGIMSKKMGGIGIKNKSISYPPVVAPGGPPIQTTRSSEGDKRPGFCSEKLCITYNLNGRSFCLAITQQNLLDRAIMVESVIEEKVEGKALAKLSVFAIADHAKGASCGSTSKFSGAVEMEKEKFYTDPIPETEFVSYHFTDLKSTSSFVVEKKTNGEFVERITAAHILPISEDAVYYVAIKITPSNKGEGLSVEVEGPIKHSKDFADQLREKFNGKLVRNCMQKFFNGVFNGSGGEDMKLLQFLGSQVNAGMQSQKGLTNSSGFMMGLGNGALFNHCMISPFNK